MHLHVASSLMYSISNLVKVAFLPLTLESVFKYILDSCNKRGERLLTCHSSKDTARTSFSQSPAKTTVFPGLAHTDDWCL